MRKRECAPEHRTLRPWLRVRTSSSAISVLRMLMSEGTVCGRAAERYGVQRRTHAQEARLGVPRVRSCERHAGSQRPICEARAVKCRLSGSALETSHWQFQRSQLLMSVSFGQPTGLQRIRTPDFCDSSNSLT